MSTGRGPGHKGSFRERLIQDPSRRGRAFLSRKGAGGDAMRRYRQAATLFVGFSRK